MKVKVTRLEVKVTDERHGHETEGQCHTSKSRAELKVKLAVKGQGHETETNAALLHMRLCRKRQCGRGVRVRVFCQF